MKEAELYVDNHCLLRFFNKFHLKIKLKEMSFISYVNDNFSALFAAR